jgi:hypothetical protein
LRFFRYPKYPDLIPLNNLYPYSIPNRFGHNNLVFVPSERKIMYFDFLVHASVQMAAESNQKRVDSMQEIMGKFSDMKLQLNDAFAQIDAQKERQSMFIGLF